MPGIGFYFSHQCPDGNFVPLQYLSEIALINQQCIGDPVQRIVNAGNTEDMIKFHRVSMGQNSVLALVNEMKHEAGFMLGSLFLLRVPETH